MKPFFKVLIGSIIILLLSSCNPVFDGIKGKGPIKTKNITTLTDFNKVNVSNGLEVILINGNENKVHIQTNENLLEYILAYVKDETLIIRSEKNIYNTDMKRIEVTFKELNKIESNGGSSISSNDVIKNKTLELISSSGSSLKLEVRSDHLTCKSHSGSTLNISGFANYLNATSESGSTLSAKDLMAGDVIANSHSGSSMKVHAKDSFKGNASSGSNIRYFGNPKTVSESENSGANIRKM